MSLDAVQVNKRIGLGQSSFGSQKIGSGNTKTTGLSAQATKNLSGASIANKPSVFSFREQSGYHRVYGQNAVKGKTDLTRRRAAVNAQNQGVRSSYNNYSAGMIYAQPQVQQQHMSTLDKIGIGLQIGMQAFNLGKQIFGGANNGQAIDQGMASLGGGGTQIQMSSAGSQSAISGMQNAQTSGELSGAITGAKAELASMQNTATSGNFESKATEAKSNMADYKQNVTTGKTDVKNAEQGVKTADQGVQAKQDMRDNALNAVKKADAEYGRAEEAYTKANDNLTQSLQNLSNAETTLANTPETIKDENGNDIPNKAYTEAKKAVETAKENVDKAGNENQKAIDECSKIRNTRTEANQELSTAIENLTNSQGALNTAKTKQTEAKNTLITTTAKYQKAEEEYQTAQSSLQKFQEYQHDSKQLEAEIKNQEARLEKLKKQEEKQINKLNKKIDKSINKNIKSNSQIDTSNGMNLREKYLQNNIERRNDKNAQRIAQRDAIAANHIS